MLDPTTDDTRPVSYRAGLPLPTRGSLARIVGPGAPAALAQKRPLEARHPGFPPRRPPVVLSPECLVVSQVGLPVPALPHAERHRQSRGAETLRGHKAPTVSDMVVPSAVVWHGSYREGFFRCC